MDQFGISTAVRCMVEVYCQTARRTGRTTQMLDGLKDGDRVVCLTANEARRLESLCRERGLRVSFKVLDPLYSMKIFDSGSSDGRTVFDHSWVEQYFRQSLEMAERHFDKLQRESSGFGEAHLKTQRQAAHWHGRYPRGSELEP